MYSVLLNVTILSVLKLLILVSIFGKFLSKGIVFYNLYVKCDTQS